MLGGQVRVAFKTGGVASAPISPLFATAPSNYTGLDTNARGRSVDDLAGDFAVVGTAGTFIRRQLGPVMALFRESRIYDRIRLNPDKFPASSPAYRLLQREFEVGLMLNYIDSGVFMVKAALADSLTQPPRTLKATALRLIMGWNNLNLAAAPHTAIEIQDEAIVQRALRELGVTVDVDTDND
ncbi:MAG: hypothetical protein ACJAZO_003945 [Myxococcota bacterium]|jgi:hypothetical protein